MPKSTATPSDETPPVDETPDIAERVIDFESLKALAHPLRIQIFDVLATHGPFTSSGLAERLGESSGAMSYHLRQLEKHHFIREVEGKGTGRERWWERSPGGIELSNREVLASEAGKQATRLVVREFSRLKESALSDFLDLGAESLSEEWMEASVVSSSHTIVTAEQLHEFNERLFELIRKFVTENRGKNAPGSRPVEIHLNSFPVMSGAVNPETADPETADPETADPETTEAEK
jgi:DNA-binding transcriptional ArsR family regulator